MNCRLSLSVFGRCAFKSAILFLLAFVGSLSHSAPPTGFSVEDVLTGIEQPISMRFLPDGRLIVLQKKGQVLIANVAGTPVQSALYLNLADPAHLAGLDSDQERGVLDLAVDPNFPSSPYLYLFYTPSNGLNGPRARVSRFTHAENGGGINSRGQLNSEVVLWEDSQGYDSCCHFGGGLDFGPDGRLWLSTGDHFQGSYASSLQIAGGSIHRFGKDGSIPADNPYRNNAANVPSMFAYGLRNPFRSRWDLPSGRYFIGEVGGNVQSNSWEDLHLIRYVASTSRFIDNDYGTANDNLQFNGINFGWPSVEGLPPHTDFPSANIDSFTGEPIFAYKHDGITAAITGGIVYRGTQFPAAYQGAYFYADSTRDFIRYLRFAADGSILANPAPAPVDSKNPETTSYPFDLTPLGRVVSLEHGPDGSLYFVSFTDAGGAYGEPNPFVFGAVRRYVYDGGNSKPVILEYSAQQAVGGSARTKSFRIRADDLENNAMTWRIVFGDGTTSNPLQVLPEGSEISIIHTYPADGVYQARLEVFDTAHTTAVTKTIEVEAGNHPTVTLLTVTNNRPGSTNNVFRFGDTLFFAGAATDAEDGTIPASGFSWSVSFVRPGNTHPAFGPESGTRNVDFQIPTQGQGFSGPVYYRCFLSVTDSSGLRTVATTDVFPEKTNIALDTVPSGIAIQVDGSASLASPYILDTLVGFPHLITLPATPVRNGRQYQFDHWSTGATSPQILYPAPEADTALVGSYLDVGPASTVPTGGLVMHLTVENGIVSNGSSVLAWEDQSGNANDLQAIGTPTLVQGGGAFPIVVHFDGVDDALGRTSSIGLPLSGSDRTIFLLARYNQANATTAGWAGFAYGQPAFNQTFGLALTPTGNIGVQGWGGGNDVAVSPAINGVGTWLSHGVVYSGGNVLQYVNGNLVSSGSHVFNTAQGGIRLGEELNGGKNLNMDVAEVIVYNRVLSAAERTSVGNYITNRYGSGGGTNTAPSVTISTPANGASFVQGATVTMSGTASDDQQGDLSAQLNWTSDRDGALGSGTPLQRVLSVGTHVLTASVTDSGGLPGSASVQINVVPSGGSGGLITLGLVVHLESDLNVSTQTGNTVAAWLDQSGLGNDMVAVGAPTWNVIKTPSGKPAIHFNGTSDLLERSGPLGGLPAGNADRTMFVVARYTGSSAWAGVAYGNGASNQTFGLNVKHPTGELGLQGWGGGNDLISSSPGIGAGWLVQSGLVSGGTGTLFKNGTQIGQFAHVYNTALTRMVIAQEIARLGYVQMDAAAVLIYNRALTGSERATVEAYLNGKYLQASTNVAPTVTISAPTAGASFPAGTNITFTASATDPEDGNLSSQISWTSNLDGALGTGATFQRSLSAGSHTVTASVVDSGTQTGSASVAVTITSSGGGTPPALITSGLVGRWESDSGVSTAIGGVVTGWQDLTNSANHLSAVGLPTWNVVQTPSGKPAIRLNGLTDYLDRNGGVTALPASNSRRTVFAVVRYLGSSARAGVAYGNAASNQAFGLIVNHPTGELGLQGSGSGNDFISTTAGIGAGWMVQSGTVTNGVGRLYKNNTEIGQFSHNYNTVLSRIVVGQEISRLGNAQMDIAAVLIYNRALGAGDRASVQSYLSSKYLIAP